MRTLALALVAAGLLAPAAQAATVRTADPLLLGAVHTADRFWSDHGYPAACPASVWVDTSVPEALAWAPQPGCDVYFEAQYVRALERELRRDGLPSWLRRRELAGLCVTAAHERGHNLGFGHAARGVMARRQTRHPPSECVGWAAYQERTLR